MEKKDKHNEEEKLRKEIEDALNEDESSIKLEPLPDDSWSPFDQPVADMPNPTVDFYFEELLSWMYNGYQSVKHEIYTDKDYIIRHEIFPPEPDYARTGPAPYTEEYESITIEDLSLNERPAIDRIYFKSPALHVFLLSILERVKGQPEKFIATFAKQRSIIRLLEDDHDFKYQGEQKCIDLLVGELETFINSESHQLIPELYHFRGHGIIMSADLSFEKLKKLDTRTEPEYTWEFLFSKQTSDSFTKQLINVLQERKRFILQLNDNASGNHTSACNDEQDNRIDCRADNEKIIAYFMRLAQKDEAGQQIMRKEDIELLLSANFKGFQPKANIKITTPHLNQANLRYFIYKFYFQYSKTTHEAEVYAYFLKNNFTQFENTEIDVIKKGFSRKPAKYPSFLM